MDGSLSGHRIDAGGKEPLKGLNLAQCIEHWEQAVVASVVLNADIVPGLWVGKDGTEFAGREPI